MGCSEGQIRLQSPKRLFDKLVAMKAISEETFYTLTGSTASFGTPTYGTILRGRAFYTPDPRRVEADGTEAGFHCDSSYCSSLKSEIDSWKANELHGGLGHVVLFVDRGICTFAAKVEVAQGCGADAVVIVDHGTQEWTRETIRHNIIMSDDGKVRNIRIPSILVSKQDGEAFKEEIVSGEEPVLVELEWRMPSQWPVAVNFWADSGDVKATAFLQAMAPYMLRLGADVRFQIIYNVFSLEGGSEELCLSEGLYSKYPRLYCSFEPNAQVLGLTGSEVVQEALLESCLYWTTKTAPPGLKDAEFSREWWLYQQRLGDPRDGCSFDGEGKNAWGPTCSRRVLSEVLSGGQLRAVELCMADENGRRLLEFSKNNRGWTVVAVTINGARYSGQLTPESVLRAICSATAHPLTNKYRSEACNSIVVDSHTQGAPWLRANLDWRSFFFVLFLVVVICVGLSYLYYRYAKQQFVDRMQRRVQHEVQQQLQLYHRMEEPTPRKPAAAECNRLV
ncbi:vacuolar sorting receptor [Cyclospora cayetanensis]|uniref:Vacuolar sorting receptor n=1 Tax=Cyclospora cayetanensis TaxID=88456 RepID=A0A1D3CQU9_9EIME|nr:vacuolar sorting receptor [Cyclospora cayetanensis]